MSTRKLILAIVEPDIHPQVVAERAALLAQHLNCDLKLLLCDPDVESLHVSWISNIASDNVARRIAEAQGELLDDLAQPAREMGIQVTTDVLDDRPTGDAILEYAENTRVQMLVKGTRYHSASERSIFVYTDWLLIRSCSCPLYLVKDRSLSENPGICAAVDPMHSHDKPATLDKVILDFAQGFAGLLQGEVHVVHTYAPLSAVGRKATRTFKPIKLPIELITEKMKQEHREKLDALASDADIDDKHVHQLPGQTHELIPVFVRTHGIGVIVMGGLARWGIKRAVIGSSVERMMDHLTCDVLIVKADNRWDELSPD